jgi:hypothetical protein
MKTQIDRGFDRYLAFPAAENAAIGRGFCALLIALIVGATPVYAGGRHHLTNDERVENYCSEFIGETAKIMAVKRDAGFQLLDEIRTVRRMKTDERSRVFLQNIALSIWQRPDVSPVAVRNQITANCIVWFASN